jgi:putative ABC transport system permease protein
MIRLLLPEAMRAIRVNRLRTALTMLGMVIGVAAVILMLAIGAGAQREIARQISSLGANLFMVLPGASTSGGLRMGGGTGATLTLADAESIGEAPAIAAVAPLVSGTSQIVFGSANWSTMVYGVTPGYFEVRDWAVTRGGMFTDSEVRAQARVALVGRTVIDNLFFDEDPVGKTLRIKNLPFTVIGVLGEKGQSLDGRDQDDVILVPLSTAQRQLFASRFPDRVRFIMVKATSPAEMGSAEAGIHEALRRVHRIAPENEEDFAVRNLTAMAETAATTARILSLMLGAIASISLVVGGIGIMNIMLVSVTERTREIGIRLAIGARPQDILLQFLLEAVIVSIAGGIAGIALGIGGALLAGELGGIAVEITTGALALAFFVAAGIGIFFGFYPAQRAARLGPIEALRHE